MTDISLNYLPRLQMSLFRFYRLSSTFVDIGMQMKQLNDSKQYSKAIALFNSHIKKQSTPLTINQALKSCIYLNDFHRGKMIHQQLSPSQVNNKYIRTNLIRLYSKTINSTTDLHLIHFLFS